jgi:hypothetical protein
VDKCLYVGWVERSAAGSDAGERVEELVDT